MSIRCPYLDMKTRECVCVCPVSAGAGHIEKKKTKKGRSRGDRYLAAHEHGNAA